MNTLTKEWLLKTIAELEEERDAVPGIVNEDAAMSLAAMKIALASLEAEAVGEVIEQQSGMMLDGLVISEKPTYRNIKGIHNMKMMPLGTQFYTAPPAPVSVPAAMEMDDDFDSAFEHGKAVGWNACRAAMLQGADGNSPVIPGGWVACSERIPEAMVSVLVTGTWFHHAVAFWDGLSWCDLDFEQPVTHWMPLPAAPQQEVK